MLVWFSFYFSVFAGVCADLGLLLRVGCCTDLCFVLLCVFVNSVVWVCYILVL